MSMRSCLDIAALVVAFVAVGIFLPLSRAAGAGDTGNVAVVFAPWTDETVAARFALEAGAQLIRGGNLPFVVVVKPEALGYAERARRAGAWFVLDSDVVGCRPQGSGPIS